MNDIPELLKTAIECGADYAEGAGMETVWHIAEYAEKKRLGLPVDGLYIEGLREDVLVTDEDFAVWCAKNDIHPKWIAKKLTPVNEPEVKCLTD